MTFDWYKVLNAADFEETGLPSREVQVLLEGIGLETILVTNAISIGVLFQGVFLQPNLLDANPFVFESRAAYIDSNDDLWVGVLQT